MKRKYKIIFAFTMILILLVSACFPCFAETVDDTPNGWLMKFVYNNSGESIYDSDNNMAYFAPGSKFPYHENGMGGDTEMAVYELPPITIFARSRGGDEIIVHLSDYPVADLLNFDDYDEISNGVDTSEIPRSITFYDYYTYEGIDILWTMDGEVFVELTYNDGNDCLSEIIYFEIYLHSTYDILALDPFFVPSIVWNNARWFAPLGGEIELMRDTDSLYQSGYDRGYNNGLSNGFESGKEVGFESGFQQGEIIGDEAGFLRGYDSGKKAGFAAADTSTAWMDFRNLIFSIFDAPMYALSTAFDFTIFGINVGGFFLSLLGIGLLVFIVRLIVLKKG